MRELAARRAHPETGAPVAGIACMAALLGLAALLARSGLLSDMPPPPPATAVATAPPPDWSPVAGPPAVFALPAPELRGLPLVVAARRHREGGHEDVLSWGAFSGDGLHLRLAIRRGDPEPRPPSFFIDLVRHAAEAGFAVTRSGTPVAVATKLGPVETADVAVEEAVERACLAFRSEHPEADLRLLGWLCGSAERPADRAGLACLIDRLQPRPGAEDAMLRAFFAAAEERRLPACLGRTSWLEAPLLRGTIPGTP
ncbi:MAG TPA: hypothetical protein VEA41_19145 [Salinarimonas sp.]|nr:hypothetical protein [Salinarimonas sp.]